MKWLQAVLPSAALLRRIDHVTEQALDELGAFCYSVRTRSVGWGSRLTLFIYIQSDTITREELEMFRPWIANMINQRLGTRLRADQLYLQCCVGLEWPQASLDTHTQPAGL